MNKIFFSFIFFASSVVNANGVFDGIVFQNNDSILIRDDSDQTLFAWQPDKALVPASLVKLATANLAINKWGLTKRFKTDFYLDGKTLWIKGYGDPFIVSEELDLIANKLLALKLGQIDKISIDASFFDIARVPGRSSAADPYNAPLSAVSANFNTVNLSKRNGFLKSAEPQTPLTNTAIRLAKSMRKKAERVNLINSDNAQLNFAEMLAIKLQLQTIDIEINQVVPKSAKHVYQHLSSHTLTDVLQGTLEYSNNFMANQVFIKLGEGAVEQKPVSGLTFKVASGIAMSALSEQFNWQHGHNIVEGSGLSRDNRLSAKHLSDLLVALEPNKTLFKKIKNKSNAQVYAKTGTLDGVRSYAGYIQLSSKKYHFVFNFNRQVAYRYRDQMLERLLQDLIARHKTSVVD